MKILIIGFGSIGQRHYRNLLQLGFNDLYVFDTDLEKTADKKIKTINRINKEILKIFNAVLICSPNNLHIKTAIQCAKANCHLFIEKPLSHNLRGIDGLQKLCEKKKIINMVACNMRFHPCLKFIKSYLDKNKLGRIYCISHEFGLYLPYYRSHQDYRKNYAAKKETGGGIILDDTHEFDLLFWLNKFSKVTRSHFMFDKISNLEIETEDICVASFQFENKVMGVVKCDYLQQHYSKNCKIVGEIGNIEWDFNENIVWLKTKEKKENIFEAKNYDLNTMYIDEIKYFLNCIRRKQKTFNDIITARTVLQHLVRRA